MLSFPILEKSALHELTVQSCYCSLCYFNVDNYNNINNSYICIYAIVSWSSRMRIEKLMVTSKPCYTTPSIRFTCICFEKVGLKNNASSFLFILLLLSISLHSLKTSILAFSTFSSLIWEGQATLILTLLIGSSMIMLGMSLSI